MGMALTYEASSVHKTGIRSLSSVDTTSTTAQFHRDTADHTIVNKSRPAPPIDHPKPMVPSAEHCQAGYR